MSESGAPLVRYVNPTGNPFEQQTEIVSFPSEARSAEERNDLVVPTASRKGTSSLSAKSKGNRRRLHASYVRQAPCTIQ